MNHVRQKCSLFPDFFQNEDIFLINNIPTTQTEKKIRYPRINDSMFKRIVLRLLYVYYTCKMQVAEFMM